MQISNWHAYAFSAAQANSSQVIFGTEAMLFCKLKY